MELNYLMEQGDAVINEELYFSSLIDSDRFQALPEKDRQRIEANWKNRPDDDPAMRQRLDRMRDIRTELDALKRERSRMIPPWSRLPNP